MDLTPWLIFFFAFITMDLSKASEGAGASKNAMSAPPRPVISNIFQVQVEAIFKDKRVGAEGTLYFDQPNNIAAMDVLWQGDFAKQIYSFDTNEVISIKGYRCDVTDMTDDPSMSFFPFTIDPESKRKMLASPEEALYFKNSKYVQDTYDGAIESNMYQGYIDVPMYNRKNCLIIHQFSKTDFETATCDSEFCKPVLLTISVSCKGAQGDDVDHLYKFFHFEDTIQDESVFHPPPGVYCERKETKGFPFLPMYFSFSYDINIHDVGVLQSLHKKIWYDGDMELLRVDGFQKDGLLHDIHIYDFYNEMSYVAIPQLEQTDKGELPKGLSLEMVTLLPNEIFPRNLEKSVASPVYVGLREAHGIEYSVWSVMKEDDFRVVTEMYFLTAMSEVNGEVKEAGLQLSYLEVYMYSTDEESGNLELSEIKFIPINNFRSLSRDWSVFDVSSWFDSEGKRAFEISVTGPKLIPESKSYGNFLEQLYLEIITAASISLTRISKLEVLPGESNPAANITIFRGAILENLNKFGYDKPNNESDLNTAFSQLEEIINGEGVEFIISDNEEETQTYLLNSFKQARTENKDKKNLYSGGTVAGVALTMLIVGVFAAIFGLGLLRRKMEKNQEEQSFTRSMELATVKTDNRSDILHSKN